MKLKPFTGPGSTPSRRRFWDNVTQAVIASEKLAGRFVTVDEHPGKGTVINVADSSTRRGGGPPSTTGACCDDEGNCTITTEGECTGIFQGIGVPCDPNPCQGCCCGIPFCDEGLVVCDSDPGSEFITGISTLAGCNAVGGRFILGAEHEGCNLGECNTEPGWVCCDPEQFCCVFGGVPECDASPCPELVPPP